MFYYLKGVVGHVAPNLAVIDCGGVGYACRTTSYTLSSLKKGEKGKVFTYLHVREDAMELYGEFGLPISISEVSIPSFTGEGEDEENRFKNSESEEI